MSHKPMRPVPIYSQKCWQCERLLRHGDKAIADMHKPIAFCVECAGEREKKHPELCQAVVDDPPPEER